VRLFSLIVFVIFLFLSGFLFLRGRSSGKEISSAFIILILFISGILFVLIGKIAVFLALLAIGIILIASRLR
jgi:heme A synthase